MQDFGSCWDVLAKHVRYYAPANVAKTQGLDDTGFRLSRAVDNEDRVSRGSVWEDSELFSQLPYSEKSKGDFRGDALSIRLAFDREEG